MPEVGEIVFSKRDPTKEAVWDGSVWVERNRTSGPPIAPAMGRLNPIEEKQLGEARNAAINARLASQKAGEFMRLNSKTGTGGLMAIPGVSEIAGAFIPEISTMQGVSNAMVPGMHTTPGPMTDADAKLYRSAIPNPNLPGATNASLSRSIHKNFAMNNARAAFMDRWAQHKGTLKGAEAAFNQWWASYGPKVDQKLSGKLPTMPKGLPQKGGLSGMSDDDLKAELGL